jgi:hypothetical protein
MRVISQHGPATDEKILKLDLSGILLDSWASPTLGYPHGVCADAKRNLYAAEGGRATKFRIRAQ